MNKDLNTKALAETLKTMIGGIKNADELLKQSWSASEMTPLAVYLDGLRKRAKHKRER